MTQRYDLLRRLRDSVASLERRAIVAVDGVDGAGKTVFADELASLIVEIGRPVVRASVDGFHNPRSFRYRRGKSDPLGYFEDSYNYAVFRSDLLEPFRMGANTIAIARFDHTIDAEISKTTIAEPSAVLLIDGIFLHRDELASLWSFSVFLSVPFSVSYARMANRDGSNPDPLAFENKRYYEGQQIYLRNCQPETRASAVIDNSLIEAPKLRTERPRSCRSAGAL